MPGHYRGEVALAGRSASFEVDIVGGQVAEVKIILEGR